MNFLNKFLSPKEASGTAVPLTLANDAIADAETAGYSIYSGHRQEWEKMLLQIAQTPISKDTPDEIEALHQRLKDVSNYDSLYQFARQLATVENWWEGDPDRREFVQKLTLLALQNGYPHCHEIDQYLPGTYNHWINNAPSFLKEYAEFMLEQWLASKQRIKATLHTVQEFFGAIYYLRLRQSDWLPRYEAAVKIALHQLAVSLGLSDLPLGSAADEAVHQLGIAFNDLSTRMGNEGKWAEVRVLSPEAIPGFKEIMAQELSFRSSVVCLLVFYQQFHNTLIRADMYKKMVKQLITADLTYPDLLRIMRIPSAPHSDVVRVLAQKQKKEPLPAELVNWLSESLVLSKYQKVMDAHFANALSSNVVVPVRASVISSGFLSTVEAGDYNYAHAQTRYRQIQEWTEDVLTLLSQVCEVQVISIKPVPLQAQYAWQQEALELAFSLRFPDGRTHQFEAGMATFSEKINLILKEMGSDYRISCQEAQSSSRSGYVQNTVSATHIRLVTHWMLLEFSDVFTESPGDLFFGARLPATRPLAMLKSLAEVKKARGAAQRSGGDEGILTDMRFAHFVETVVEKIEDAEAIKPLTAQVLSFSSGAKPTEKWRTALQKEQNKLGTERYIHTLMYLLDHVYRTELWYEESRLSAIKGMLWALSMAPDRQSWGMIRQVVEYAYAKIPGKGPRATGLGDLGLKILAESANTQAFAQLALMRSKTKYPRFKKQLDKAVQKFATQSGLSEEQLEDSTIDDFELKEGRVEALIGDYAVVLTLEENKAILHWYDPKGNELKSTPSALKNSHAAEVKALQLRQKELQQTLSVQIQRLDRNWLDNRSWSWEQWEPVFRQHELMRFFGEKVIWEFDLGQEKVVGMALPDALLRPEGTVPYPDPASIQSIRVWHPATAPVAETLAWRQLLVEKQWKQPFKQAFREIYLLTEAELGTVDHSNRFAGHILKTNNLLAIAPQRSWDFVYEHYDCAFPKRHLPAWQLRADYDLAQAPLGGLSPTGRLHFQKMGADTSWVNLVDIPAVVFSEVLRDVDMFVAVTSIGSDPNWQANGHEQEAYWRNYAYGSLSQSQGAEERKKILEMMIPRTKLAKNARIEGNFVVVKGKFRTYKINIGSGNILMEPNDQYLCIVPAPSEAAKVSGKVWLPFDGDSLLTLVLSKAFLLADDDKITDRSIMSQIRL